MKAKELFLVKREKGEIDLLLEITKLMVRVCGKESAKHFRDNREIALIEDLNSISQRITINRVLNRALLMFRASNEVDISEVMIYLFNDGSNDEWLSLMEEITLPFFAKFSIIKYLG